MSRGLIAAVTAVLTLFAAPAARADSRDLLEPQRQPATAADGFQAGPCTVDMPVKCSPTTFSQFFKTAGGHPPVGFVQLILRHEVLRENEIEPLFEPIRGRVPRTVRVDLPPGLAVNPQATTEECTRSEFFNRPNGFPECKEGTRLGEVQVKLVTGEPNAFGSSPTGTVVLPDAPGLTRVQLYNLEPFPGEPALFGFVVAGLVPVLLRTEVAWESDFHESFTIEGLPDYKSLPIGAIVIHSTRLITFGNVGDGTLATNPTTCFNSDVEPFRHLYSSWMRLDSFERPDLSFPFGTTAVESPLPIGVHPEGCGNIPFDPTIEVDPGVAEVDSAATPTVTTRLKVEIPARGDGEIATSHLRKIEVALPEGMGLNPAGSAGLLACADADFRKGQRIAQSNCPPGSVIGSAEIRTPALSQPLRGDVYVGEPRSSDPASGEEFRIFVEGKALERGILARLIGNVRANPRTGQLTATFDEQEVSPFFGNLPRGLPQVPFESISLRFDGPRKVFTTPPTCSPATTTASLEPWARPGTHATVPSPFTLSAFPGGGPCPQSLAERPFKPFLAARPDDAGGGSFSPFRLRVLRTEGHQEIKGIDLTLPNGLIGRLAGIPYCPEAVLAAAPSRRGAAERAAPSCPAASLVGSTATDAGSGGEPLRLPGKVYLAGPYRGAPLSLAAITPALSGPFDLGNVVIRVALRLDPASARITAVSDPIPDVYGGVKLSLRTIDLNLDRARFMLNPTSCTAQAVAGTISGGGSDPANPAAFGAFRVQAPFRATGCDSLGFQPKLTTTLAGEMKRGKFPRLTATLSPREGDANVARVALTLPKAFLVAQQHIGTVCTRPQLAARACPPSSVYGEAEARSPLLDQRLAGPVYLVPSGNALPDLVLDLRGQVDIQLHGVISAKGGKVQTVFAPTPDVPLQEFTLRMAGGKKGLLANTTSLCKARPRAALSIEGHNGKQLGSKRYKLNLAGCKKRKKHGKHRRHER
jgi:hypothetical protein